MTGVNVLLMLLFIIFRDLSNIPSQSLIDTVNKASEESTRAQESVQDSVSGISDILTMLPEQSQMAKQVPKNLGDSRDAINQADIQCTYELDLLDWTHSNYELLAYDINFLVSVRSLSAVKSFTDTADNVNRRQSDLDRNGAYVKSSIDDLKKKVVEAKEKTNRWVVLSRIICSLLPKFHKCA